METSYGMKFGVVPRASSREGTGIVGLGRPASEASSKEGTGIKAPPAVGWQGSGLLDKG